MHQICWLEMFELEVKIDEVCAPSANGAAKNT